MACRDGRRARRVPGHEAHRARLRPGRFRQPDPGRCPRCRAQHPRRRPPHQAALRLPRPHPDDDLRRVFLVAVESADTLVQLAFRTDPDGDEAIITETRELLRAYLARVLD
nr:hypothetical protein [Streptomyces fodineus]